MSLPRFRSFDVRELESIAPLFREERCGIYILEFSNGDRYVGQAKDVTRRFAQHRHGGNHHPSWPDIIRLEFSAVPECDLDVVEKMTIQIQRAHGHRLRNKTWNFDFSGPSVLDEWLPPIRQVHWASGDVAIDRSAIEQAASRKAGPIPRLFTTKHGLAPWAFNTGDETWTVADSVTADCASIIEILPNPVELEGEYWTLSDYPNTSGGRFATLITGSLELIYFPRVLEDLDSKRCSIKTPCAHLNLPPGSLFTDGGDWNPELPDETFSWFIDAGRAKYPMTQVDQLVVPIGFVKPLVQIDYLRNAVRQISLTLMRKGPSSMFRRWHCRELARRTYELIAEGTHLTSESYM